MLLYGKPSPELVVSRKHRISFAYVEYARVLREENSVVARNAAQDIDLPIANLNALLLGTGTSITTEAVAEISRWGCNISFVAGGGLGISGSHQSSSSRTARLIVKQAEIVSSPKKRLAAARNIYSLRWGAAHVPEDVTIKQLMQLEGSRMRSLYKSQSERTGVDFHFRKQQVDFLGDDKINQMITAGNQVMYGLVGAVIVSLGLSPALGVIHHGHANSFVFDIADLYKESLIIPLAFDMAKQGADHGELRKYLRAGFKGLKIVPSIIDNIYASLGLSEDPALTEQDGESLLWAGDETINNRGNNLGVK